MTISEALTLGRTTLANTSDAPDLDAIRLLQVAIGAAYPTSLLTNPDNILTALQLDTYQQLLTARQQGQPLAYILGTQEFYGRDFIVTPDVLIPRPSTESLIDQALLRIAELTARYQRPLVIADIGTGSGCIAITLASEMSSDAISHLDATDISAAALKVAKDNVARYQLQSRITLQEGNLLDALTGQDIDLIVSNPPYVPSNELIRAHHSPIADTRGLIYEPQIALDGGPDGQLLVRQLQAAGLPTIIETTNGEIITCNF